MEKNGGGDSSKAAKVLKQSGINVKDNDAKGAGGGVGGEEPLRKRRGRPKKVKPEDGGHPTPVNNKASVKGGGVTSVGGGGIGGGVGVDGGYERGGIPSAASILSSQQKASSISSGYSTGTAGSNSSEDRCRRDENGSLSNAGSSGLSPSHHSFTTQSDLSSEISAAISCGSCPPSPTATTNNNSNNNQTETVFESLSMSRNNPSIDLNNHLNNKQQVINSMHGGGSEPTNNCGNLYQSNSGVMDAHQPHEQQSYSIPQYQPSYDNRFHHVSNRSQSYIPAASSRGSYQPMDKLCL